MKIRLKKPSLHAVRKRFLESTLLEASISPVLDFTRQIASERSMSIWYGELEADDIKSGTIGCFPQPVTDSFTVNTDKCKACGAPHKLANCAYVRAVEYYESGNVKRIEFNR